MSQHIPEQLHCTKSQGAGWGTHSCKVCFSQFTNKKSIEACDSLNSNIFNEISILEGREGTQSSSLVPYTILGGPLGALQVNVTQTDAKTIAYAA